MKFIVMMEYLETVIKLIGVITLVLIIFLGINVAVIALSQHAKKKGIKRSGQTNRKNDK